MTFNPFIQVPTLQNTAAVNKEETMVVEDSPKEMQEHSVCLEYNNCLPFSGKEQFGAHNQEKYRTTRPSEVLHRHLFCFVTILVMVISMVMLSVTLTVRNKRAVSEEIPASKMREHPACPPMWIGFGNKCFYFSEETGNWTFSQIFCVSKEAHLVQIDTSDELKFLKRYKGPYDHWIGLSRESPSHAWKWTSNTGGNVVFHVRGTEKYAYLNDSGVSSSRVYSEKRWICSKPHVSTSQTASHP